jgi:hypothetical protein
MTQIMNLLHLAPDIQEALLFLPPVRGREESVSERDLRKVAAERSWMRQRANWRSKRIARPPSRVSDGKITRR